MMKEGQAVQYWRMQLHPSAPKGAARYAIESLAAGFVGLDFAKDLGDLKAADRGALPEGQRDYWDFANRMNVGDRVLVIVHHFPFAVATIAGDYNYIKEPVGQLGVWFRHFRPVNEIAYYADRVTNASNWERIVMTDTISRLQDSTRKSYRLIEEW